MLSDYIGLLNFTDCFGCECFALAHNTSLQILSKPFLSRYVLFTQTHIPPANAAYHQCLQWKKAYALFNLSLHHCAAPRIYKSPLRHVCIIGIPDLYFIYHSVFYMYLAAEKTHSTDKIILRSLRHEQSILSDIILLSL